MNYMAWGEGRTMLAHAHDSDLFFNWERVSHFATVTDAAEAFLRDEGSQLLAEWTADELRQDYEARL